MTSCGYGGQPFGYGGYYGYGGSANVAESLRYGQSTLIDKASENATNQSFFPLLPSHQRGVLTQWSAYFKTAGNFKIIVLRRNGYTWDRVYLSDTIAVSTGVSTFGPADFGTVNIEVGDIVGFFTPGTGGARVAYQDGELIGCYNYTRTGGEPAASGNTLTANSNTVRNWQFSYSVRGVVETSNTLFDEPFEHTGIPLDWAHQSAAWTYDETKATSSTEGVANSLNFRWPIGNLSQWTWTTDFTFDTASARILFCTRNTVQSDRGMAFEINSGDGNLVNYYTISGSGIGWTNSGALDVLATEATGITFATATPYRVTCVKEFGNMSITITDIGTPANTFTLSWVQEDSTVDATYGLAYGCPSFASMAGTVSILGTSMTVPDAKPDMLFIGDSNTNGVGLADTTLMYPKLIEADLNWSMLTSAQGGASTAHSPRRLAAELIFIRPKRVHFLIGTNDTDAALWKARMAGMRDILNGICQRVVVGCVPAEAADSNPEVEMNPYIIAQGWETVRYDLVFSTDGTGANRIGALYSDTLHFTTAAHALMRDRFRADLGV